MPIPDNIDPFRALALCFGVELPPEGKNARSEAINRLCEYLDITAGDRRQLKRSLAPELKKLQTWSTQELEWLDFPEVMSGLFQAFVRVSEVLKSGLKPEIWTKLSDALDSPRLPPEIFTQLVPAFLNRFSPPNTQADRPRAFCSKLLALHPHGFNRALQACDKDSESSSSDNTFKPEGMEPLARAMDRFQQAADSEDTRRAIDNALQAWKGAYEDSVYKTCLFLWYMAQPLTTPPERLIPPQGAASRNRPDRKPEIKKGQVFQEARDWCIRQGREFPFHPKLDKLRNAIAHEDFTVLADGVELRGQDGVIATISGEQLVEQVHNELEFAFYFRLGAQEAWLSHSEQSETESDAWAAAVELLPALASATKQQDPKSRKHSSKRGDRDSRLPSKSTDSSQ